MSQLVNNAHAAGTFQTEPVTADAQAIVELEVITMQKTAYVFIIKKCGVIENIML